MGIVLYLLGLCSSLALAWYMYLERYLAFAGGTIYFRYLVIASFVCTLFLSSFEVMPGEVGEIRLFGFSFFGITVSPGLYFLPSFPFFRNDESALGFSISRIKIVPVNNENIRVLHSYDRTETDYRAVLETKSLTKHRVSKKLDFFERTLSLTDVLGQLRYYRAGRTGFVVLFITTFFLNQFYPSTNRKENNLSTLCNEVVGYTSIPIRNFVCSSSVASPSPLLQYGIPPSVLDDKGYEVHEEQDEELTGTVEGDPREYVFYTRQPKGELMLAEVKEDQFRCVIIPPGKFIGLKMGRKPQYVDNIENWVGYDKGRTMPTWKEVHANWPEQSVTGRFVVVKAVDKEGLNGPHKGGVICF